MTVELQFRNRAKERATSIGNAGLTIVAALLLAIAGPACGAQVPQIGAQIWIEPGQASGQIDGFFRQLEDSRMPVDRLFLMWTYLAPKPGVWDFPLYDEAFAAAEKHHIDIVATLTPSGPPPFLGGDGTQGEKPEHNEDGYIYSLPAKGTAVSLWRPETS